MFGGQFYRRSNGNVNISYTVNYYSTMSSRDLINFNSNIQEILKKANKKRWNCSFPDITHISERFPDAISS